MRDDQIILPSAVLCNGGLVLHPTVSLIFVFLMLSHLVLFTALRKQRISMVVIFLSRVLFRVQVFADNDSGAQI